MATILNHTTNNNNIVERGVSSFRFLMALMLLLESAQGFSIPMGGDLPVSLSSRAPISTALNAISIPIDDTTFSRGSRKSRIEQVLQRARARTATLDSPTKNRQQQAESSTPTTPVSAVPTSLPFALPTLTPSQRHALVRNEIVMHQSEMGRQGQGFMVQDIECNEETVWNTLLDFESYTEHIHTVRSATVNSDATTSTTQQRTYGSPSITKASFDVSKFRFTIGALLDYRPEQNYMELSLDNGFQNNALQHAKGVWHTQKLENNKTRVWLMCDLTVSSLLPSFIVNQAAQSAMPRASSWLRPTIAERLQQDA